MALGYINSWGNYATAIHANHTNAITYHANYAFDDAYVKKSPGSTLKIDGATYFPAARYGGTCTYCLTPIEKGDPIWWRWWRRKDNKPGNIWCGSHKDHTTTDEAPASTEDHKREHDMALRQNFTFPYSGQEIADSLERKAAKLDAKVGAPAGIDRETVELLHPNYSPRDIDEIISQKTQVVTDRRKGMETKAAELRREAIPYAKAGKQAFDIDLEDVEHFGLNDADAPVKARRTRKPRATEPVDEVAIPA